SAKEYGLYLGVMNPKTYIKLSAFKTEDYLTIKDFLTRKIFSSQTDNPDQDIENVYFDGDLIYVENTASIYYFDSTWKEIKKLDELPCRINVTSDPPGAFVYVNNVYQGATPLFLGAIYEPSAVVRLEAKGYFIAENFIDLQSGILLEKNYELRKKPTFEDGSEIDIEAYSAENTESVIEITQRIETIRTSAIKIGQDSTKAVDAFVNGYPVMTPKDQFETTEEFAKRQLEFNTKFNNERDELCRQFHEKRKRVLDIIPRMEIYLDSIKEREYTKYFDGSLLKLSKYDADSGYFPVDLSVDEEGFAFSFTGKLFIPRDQAKEFYSKGTKSGKILLIYKNWQIALTRDSVKQNYYVYYSDFKLKFKDINYDLKGTWVYPAFIENSIEYSKFKSALDKKIQDMINAREARGTVSIEIQPNDLKPEAFIGTTRYGTAPCSLRLQPGKYLLALKADGYSIITDSVVVVKDSLITVNYQMKHTKAYLDSLSTKKLLVRKKIQKIRRIAFLSMAATAGGIGYFFQNDAKKDYQYYKNLPPNAGSEYDNAWHHFTEDSKWRNVWYAVSGVSLGLFVVSIPF
ncbi:MAG TPA: PEGA domain-containing protein, partial [Chitinispirillaceae bacterium]|nr:PEGA domain-containing protein [Chitinispirillaceae bacterium]